MQNIEIGKGIKTLHKKLKTYSQNIEPSLGKFVGQMFYDRIDGNMKSWTGYQWEVLRGDLKVFTDYLLIRNVDGSADKKVVCGFKPKYIEIYSIYPNGYTADSNSVTISTPSGNITTTSYTIYNFRDKYTEGSGSSSSVPCVKIYRDGTRQQELHMKTFDNDGFTMEHSINGLNDAGLHILAIG